MESNFAHGQRVTGQGRTTFNWKEVGLHYVGINSLLWGWGGTGTSCPENMLIFHPLQLRLDGDWASGASVWHPCLYEGVELDELQGAFQCWPFYDSHWGDQSHPRGVACFQRACSRKNLADRQFSCAKRFSYFYTLHLYSVSCNCEQNSILLFSLVAAAFPENAEAFATSAAFWTASNFLNYLSFEYLWYSLNFILSYWIKSLEKTNKP